jgi:hypothetical protein
MKIKISFLLIFVLYALTVNAQNSSNTKLPKAIIVPAVLIGTGLILNGSDIEHRLRTNIRERIGNDYKCKIDDYTQFAPLVELYAFDISGVKTKNHWFDQTKYLIISNALTIAIIQGMKHIILKTRPDGSAYSFPSGHTSFAFTNATVLYNEFKNSSPFIAYSGYFFASTTGTFRILNDKHWLSDVLTGAGIGIIIANLVYYFEPLKSFNPFLASKNISFIPQINNNNIGIYFNYSF